MGKRLATCTNAAEGFTMSTLTSTTSTTYATRSTDAIEITSRSAAAIPVGRGDALAASLAECAPRAGALSDLAFDTLSPAGCLDAVIAWERQARHDALWHD